MGSPAGALGAEGLSSGTGPRPWPMGGHGRGVSAAGCGAGACAAAPGGWQSREANSGSGGGVTAIPLPAPILFRLAPHRRCRRVHDFDPTIDPAGAVWGAESLRHDALTAECTGMLIDDRAVIVVWLKAMPTWAWPMSLAGCLRTAASRPAPSSAARTTWGSSIFFGLAHMWPNTSST
jgi:hypothetical protein